MPTIQQTTAVPNVTQAKATVKKAKSADNKPEVKEANVDKNMINSPDKILAGEIEAAELTSSVKTTMLKDPLSASVSHAADYRLMDIMRS